MPRAPASSSGSPHGGGESRCGRPWGYAPLDGAIRRAASHWQRYRVAPVAGVRVPFLAALPRAQGDFAIRGVGAASDSE